MTIEIKLKRTAIKRNKPSRPCRELYEKTLYLPEKCTVLDYGCGRGDDVLFLKKKGYQVTGYDSYYQPEELSLIYKYDLVMSNYVLCVIPDSIERHNLILKMWNNVASKGCLSISVRSKKEIETAKNKNWTEYKDGWITSHQTFQKGFTEEDLIELVFDLPNIAYIETETQKRDITTVRIIKRVSLSSTTDIY